MAPILRKNMVEKLLILTYLEVMYNVKINVVSDYLRLLKKTEYRPIDTFLALSAVREFYDSPSFRFRATFSTPLSFFFSISRR